MAEILTRTYKYTGKSGWNVGESTVPLSSFAVSGDTRPVTQILSISASWYRKHDTSMTVTHTAQLVFGDGSTLKSASVSKRGDGDTFKISAAFSSMPSGALWDESAVKLRTLLNTKKDKVYWTATADKPMILTITYTSTEFKPSISAAKIYRADESGAALDKGTNLSFTATLSVQEAGTGGSGVFSIYKGDSPGAAAELVYQQSGIAGSTAGVVVSQVPIPGAVLERGEKKWFRMEFVYTANTESGTPSTESVSAALLVNHVFTNVHLAGVSTGGVRFGGYSTAAEDDPKFECDYPAYLYGGIAQIGDGWTYLTPINGTTPAGFGGSALRCRKIENLCIVDGSINVKPGSYVAIANLPEGYAPAYSVHAMNACSGSRIARIAVGGASEATAGQLVLHWVKNLSDGSDYTSAAIWIQCSIMYWVD